MKVIEHFLCGKENNPDTCEDGIVITPNLVAVIDGVTAKGQRLWDGQKSGCFAKNVLCEYLQQDGVAEQSAEEMFANLDRVLVEKRMGLVEQQGIGGVEAMSSEAAKNSSVEPLGLQPEEYPRASVIIYNDIHKEIWSYGDCQCRINDTVYTHSKKIDELNSDIRSFYLEHALLQGISMSELEATDPGRAAIQNMIMMQFAFENIDGEFGYSVLNGMGINESMIRKYSIHERDNIVLASDGYPEVCDTLEKSEKALEVILQDDPMCFRRYKTTKGLKAGNVSFDDRAYCRVRV